MVDEDIQIGPYVLCPSRRTLTLDGKLVHLGDRAFDLLCIMAERPGEVISKRELLERVWPGTFVEEGSLRFHVAALRKVLDPVTQVQILNVAGRGYALSVVGSPAIPELREPRRAHNLPARRSRLIGRDDTVAELVAEVRVSPVVTLVGPGGVGKTSVALAVAEDLLEQFDRICLVDFGPVDQPDKALLSIVVALQISAETDDVLPIIVADLSYGSTLLVLDNCEHVVGEVARLADVLLNTSARVRILATSREPLNIAFERVRRIDPLKTPSAKRSLTAAEALQWPAVQLFAERASYANAYVLADEDAAAVAETCHRLDGLPLAIEMAAGWIRFFPPKTLASQLVQRPLLSLQGRRTAQSRHRTLEAMLDWSYETLNPRQQRLLACLSVFRGAFSMEQAQGVALSSPSEALLDLAELVEKSLVEAHSELGQARYRMLMVPRTYAETKLRETGHEHEVRRRHALSVLKALQTSSREWSEAHRPEWLELAGRLVDDSRAALDWALGDSGDAVLAGELAHEAAAIGFRLALPFEGPDYLDAALERLSRTPYAPPSLALRLKLERMAVEIYAHGAPEVDQAELNALDRHVQDSDDQNIYAIYAWTRWLLSAFSGQFTTGLEFAERMSAINSDAALYMRSVCHSGLGNLAESQEGFEQVLRRLGDARRFRGVPIQHDQLSSTNRHLSRVRWLRGDPKGAMDAAREAVRVAEAAHHSTSLSAGLMDALIMVSLLNGDYDLAEAAIDRYRAMPVTGEFHRDVVEGLRGALIGQIDPRAAAPLVRTCFEGDGLREIVPLAPALGDMVECLGRAGDPDLGLFYLDEIFKRRPPEPADVNVPDLLRAKAALLRMQGQKGWREQADALLDEALAQSMAQGSLAWELRIRTDQARLWAANDRSEEAIAALQDVLSRYPATDTRDRVAAERLLADISAVPRGAPPTA